MNREILFRGKREDGLGDWVYGYLIIEPDGTNWIDHYPDGLRRTTKVIPESVGQFTGLTDKNGVKIWEGDIISGSMYHNVIVEWDNTNCGWNITGHAKTAVVSGNIHDSPELIK